MRKRLLSVAALSVAAVFLVHLGRAQDPLDSLVVCRATQKMIFENAFVRAIDDVIPPGVSEPKHHHPHGVVVALVDADTETRSYPNGKAIRRHTAAGTVTWNEAMTHEVKNVGVASTHFIRIDLK